MKQLSGTDNLFLVQEKGHQMMHVAALAIYDQSSVPGGKLRFKTSLELLARRLSLAATCWPRASCPRPA